MVPASMVEADRHRQGRRRPIRSDPRAERAVRGKINNAMPFQPWRSMMLTGAYRRHRGVVLERRVAGLALLAPPSLRCSPFVGRSIGRPIAMLYVDATLAEGDTTSRPLYRMAP